MKNSHNAILENFHRSGVEFLPSRSAHTVYCKVTPEITTWNRTFLKWETGRGIGY